MNQIINIFYNKNKKSQSIREEVQEKLESRGFTISYDNHPDGILNLCIGGDGAFLRAVHDSNFSPIPFVGINTGHLGFYQEILIPHIDRFIDDFIHQNYHVESLFTLQAQGIIHGSNQSYRHRALNEFVIKNSDNSIIYIDVYVDDNHLETFAGDALLVSTPAGSTAYNFSAGGSILYQQLEGYQLTPLAPINSKAYRSLLNSLVIPKHAVLKMDVRLRGDHNFLLIADGITHEYPKAKISFTISETRVKKLVFNENWYWLNIKDKFL
ncbi:MAG: NAD(+)/NADH kinase [Tissierellia bacterium]|nr:NAD(+)/NADH kinase [Tissierellia bacterium]